MVYSNVGFIDILYSWHIECQGWQLVAFDTVSKCSLWWAIPTWSRKFGVHASRLLYWRMSECLHLLPTGQIVWLQWCSVCNFCKLRPVSLYQFPLTLHDINGFYFPSLLYSYSGVLYVVSIDKWNLLCRDSCFFFSQEAQQDIESFYFPNPWKMDFI